MGGRKAILKGSKFDENSQAGKADEVTRRRDDGREEGAIESHDRDATYFYIQKPPYTALVVPRSSTSHFCHE